MALMRVKNAPIDVLIGVVDWSLLEMFSTFFGIYRILTSQISVYSNRVNPKTVLEEVLTVSYSIPSHKLLLQICIDFTGC